MLFAAFSAASRRSSRLIDVPIAVDRQVAGCFVRVGRSGCFIALGGRIGRRGVFANETGVLANSTGLDENVSRQIGCYSTERGETRFGDLTDFKTPRRID